MTFWYVFLRILRDSVHTIMYLLITCSTIIMVINLIRIQLCKRVCDEEIFQSSSSSSSSSLSETSSTKSNIRLGLWPPRLVDREPTSSIPTWIGGELSYCTLLHGALYVQTGNPPWLFLRSLMTVFQWCTRICEERSFLLNLWWGGIISLCKPQPFPIKASITILQCKNLQSSQTHLRHWIQLQTWALCTLQWFAVHLRS